MEYAKKAEDFFDIILSRKKKLIEIPLNCSQGETGTLLYLTFVKDGISSSELADSLEVSLPRITSVLNSLEAKKLVNKRIDSQDKRKTIIYITDMGRKIVLEKKQEAVENIAKIMEKLDKKDIDEYIRITQKIGIIMEEMQEEKTCKK